MEQVDELHRWQRQRHRVDGEIPAKKVVGQVGAEGNLGFTRLGVVRLGAIGRDLHFATVDARADRAESDADVPCGLSEARHQGEHLVGVGVRGEVQVGTRVQPAQECVADGPADEGDLVPGGGEVLP